MTESIHVDRLGKMSEPSQLNMDEHWRRLAEELGLEAPPGIKPLTIPVPDEAPPVAAVEEARPRRRRTREVAEMADVEPIAESPVESVEIPATELTDEPARGRSRRGRGMRRPPPTEDEFEAIEPPTPAIVDEDGEDTPLEPFTEKAEPTTDDERPRRRRRGRRKKPGERGEARTASTESSGRRSAAVADAVEDTDDDLPIDSFADWSVPSWDDLIASLHRPG